jgi:hypothetical protein
LDGVNDLGVRDPSALRTYASKYAGDPPFVGKLATTQLIAFVDAVDVADKSVVKVPAYPGSDAVAKALRPGVALYIARDDTTERS